MSMQVDGADALRPEFEICEGEPALSERIAGVIDKIRWDLSKRKYGSEHPYLALTLCHLAWEYKASRFLEVGFECGGTTIPLSTVADALEGDYTAVDNQQSAFCTDEALDYILANGGECLKIMPKNGFKVEDLSGQYDFVFFDHAKQMYMPHLKELVEAGMLTDNALVFFHDVDYCKMEGGQNYDALGPVKEYAEEAGIGKCFYLRNGWSGVKCPDLGVLVIGG